MVIEISTYQVLIAIVPILVIGFKFYNHVNVKLQVHEKEFENIKDDLNEIKSMLKNQNTEAKSFHQSLQLKIQELEIELQKKTNRP